eukprot:gene38320-46568_t
MKVAIGRRIAQMSLRPLTHSPRYASSILSHVSSPTISQDGRTPEFCTNLEDSVYDKLVKLRISPESNLLLSVSGGADSMALLHIMHSIKTRHIPGLNLKVININHRQREESIEEATFVERWAKQYGLEIVLDTVPDTLANTKTGFQEAARNYRRETCLKALKELFNSNNVSNSYICLAHHLDDEMETLMLKFLRGVHISNFIAMEGVNGVFLRPLLHLTKEQLVTYMQHRALDWREDESNLSRNYKRNKVRLDLIPRMEELAGGRDAFRKRMLALVEQSEGVRQVMTYLNQEMLRKVRYASYPMYATMTIPADFASAPPIVLSDLLRQWLQSQDKLLTSKMLSRVVDAVREGGRKKEGSGLRFNTGDFDIEVLSTNKVDASSPNRQNKAAMDENNEIELRVVPKRPSPNMRKIVTLVKASGWTFEITHPAFLNVTSSMAGNQSSSPSSFSVPVVVPTPPSSHRTLQLELRFKREGDHFSTALLGQGQSISRFLQAQQVPLTERDRVLVLTQQGTGRNESIIAVILDDSKVFAKQGAALAQLFVDRLY